MTTDLMHFAYGPESKASACGVIFDLAGNNVSRCNEVERVTCEHCKDQIPASYVKDYTPGVEKVGSLQKLAQDQGSRSRGENTAGCSGCGKKDSCVALSLIHNLVFNAQINFKCEDQQRSFDELALLLSGVCSDYKEQ